MLLSSNLKVDSFFSVLWRRTHCEELCALPIKLRTRQTQRHSWPHARTSCPTSACCTDACWCQRGRTHWRTSTSALSTCSVTRCRCADDLLGTSASKLQPLFHFSDILEERGFSGAQSARLLQGAREAVQARTRHSGAARHCAQPRN